MGLKLEDRRPVLVLFDKQKRIVRAGEPSLADGKEISEVLKEGGKVKTMTIAAFRKLPNKWIYD